MSLRAICFTLIALGVSSCGTTGSSVVLPTPPAAPIYDSLIVPGQRIGPISLGLTGGQLLQIAGTPTRSTRFKDGSWNNFGNGLAAFVDDATGQVFMVSTNDPRYRTSNGVGFNASDLEIRSSLGAPVRVGGSAYRVHCYNGIEFSFAHSEHVTDTVVVPNGWFRCR